MAPEAHTSGIPVAVVSGASGTTGLQTAQRSYACITSFPTSAQHAWFSACTGQDAQCCHLQFPVHIFGCHAAGFIATELVSQLLAKGYEVRGTVRDPNNQAKVAHLVQLGQVRNF